MEVSFQTHVEVKELIRELKEKIRRKYSMIKKENCRV